ncbi:MAG: radical SAM protein [Blautia sp.]|nr:radical SAM protein [Blautia sp.]MCM1200141.1 radical SAM protein [Bacteroides fragilis]
MNGNIIHIILTDQCTAQCENCYLGCSPDNAHVADKSFLNYIIDRAKESGFAEYMNFTGGEPFLFYDLLREGAVYAKQCGFKVSVDTNGFWGNWTESEIRAKLAGLKIDKLNISVDSFHRKYIPESYIENIITVAADLNLRVRLMIGETVSGESAGHFFQNMGNYKYLCTLQIYPFILKDSTGYSRQKELTQIRDLDCGGKDMELAVKYDGAVYVPSSGRVFDRYIGNIHSEILREIALGGFQWSSIR